MKTSCESFCRPAIRALSDEIGLRLRTLRARTTIGALWLFWRRLWLQRRGADRGFKSQFCLCANDAAQRWHEKSPALGLFSFRPHSPLVRLAAQPMRGRFLSFLSAGAIARAAALAQPLGPPGAHSMDIHRPNAKPNAANGPKRTTAPAILLFFSLAKRPGSSTAPALNETSAR